VCNAKHGESHCADAQVDDKVVDDNEVGDEIVVVAVRIEIMNSTTGVEFEDVLGSIEFVEEEFVNGFFYLNE